MLPKPEGSKSLSFGKELGGKVPELQKVITVSGQECILLRITFIALPQVAQKQ